MKLLFQFLKVLVLFREELKTSMLKVRKLKFRQFKILNFPPKISQIPSLKHAQFLRIKASILEVRKLVYAYTYFYPHVTNMRWSKLSKAAELLL